LGPGSENRGLGLAGGDQPPPGSDLLSLVGHLRLTPRVAAAGVLRRVFEPALKRYGVVACALEVAGTQHIVVDVELTPWQARAATHIARQRGEGKRMVFVELVDLPPQPRARQP
jgi:hypothetical protein